MHNTQEYHIQGTIFHGAANIGTVSYVCQPSHVLGPSPNVAPNTPSMAAHHPHNPPAIGVCVPKMLQCDKCDARFRSNGSLSRHKKQCGLPKTRTCPNCPYSCYRTDSFRNHMRESHGIRM